MTHSNTSDQPTSVATIVLSWVAVGLPLAWGVSQTLAKAMTLFG